MIFCAIAASFGWHTLCDALPEGNKWLALVGFTFYAIGIIGGEIVEKRLNNRIEKLEKELRKDV